MLSNINKVTIEDDEEEDETPYDVNMEKIMARFNTYS